MAHADHTHPRLFRPLLAAIGLTLVLAACGSDADNASTSDATSANAKEEAALSTEPAESTGPIEILNHGGDLEGHTPRGFPGSGTGLFAGDELNSNFPQDDGVQIWLTFDIPDTTGDLSGITNATIRSDALDPTGNPFEALGNLEIAPVRYDSFGPQVVGIEPVGASIICPMPDGNSFTCDVSEAVADELAQGQDRVQFRLRFEGRSDPDGEADLARFFLTDSNTNEPGIFRLELSA